MKIHKTNYMIALVLLIFISLGFGIILEEYQYGSVTGKAISDGFDIEEKNEAFWPETATILRTNDHIMLEDASQNLAAKDNFFTVITPTSIPGNEEDSFLHVDFDRKVVVISLYMKKDGEDATFEIWGPTRKVGEGSLTNEFKWYTFDVSFNEMSSERYALYNYGGGEANIVIDTILGLPKPNSGLAEYLTGLAIHN